MKSKNLISLFVVLSLISGMMVTSVVADSPSPEQETRPNATSPDLSTNSNPDSVPSAQASQYLLSKTRLIQQNGVAAQFDSKEFTDIESGSVPPEDPSTRTAFSSASNLPLQSLINSLPAGMITIDMTYDVVMGWVGSEQLVQVTYGSEGYGSTVADGIGFFWTPIWHNIDGHQVGIDCGTSISISVEGTALATLTPYCFTDTHVVVNDDVIRGTLAGAGEGLMINASLGEFYSYTGINAPAYGAPTGSGVTDSSGLFEFPIVGFDLGAESVAALDFEQSGMNIRDYVIPQEVFMVHQMNSILGYTAIGQHVTATIHVGTGPDVRWTGEMDATWPLGYYSFFNLSMEFGDLVTVELSGGPTLSTTVASLSNLVFDSDINTLNGEVTDGASIRTGLWQWQGESHHYSQKIGIAGSSGFSIDFSPVDLKAYDNVLVITTDAAGNQTQIMSGAPYVDVLQDPLSNRDCVEGRLNAPYVPIFVSLDKGGDGSVDYVRETGWVSDAGNDYEVCFLIKHPNNEWGPINIDPGDIATLYNGSDWSESIEIISFNWGYDTSTNSVSGQGFPDGEMEVMLFQYYSNNYPLNGTAIFNAQIASGEFSAIFASFDVRDGLPVQLKHSNILGNRNTYYPWGISSLSYFELSLHNNAVTGWVGIPDDLVTVSLYENESATEPLVTTSQDDYEDPFQFWIDDFELYTLEPGMRVEVSSASGWFSEMIVPVLGISGNCDTNEISGTGPQGVLHVEVQRDDQSSFWVLPTDNTSSVYLQLDYYGYDLYQGDIISLTYVAPDGNMARREVRLGDLYKLGHWLNYGRQDWMWGEAIPGSSLTISINGGDPIQAYFEDPNCPHCWGIHDPQDINPGDTITISMDTGYSLSYSIPNPLTSTADSVLDTVSGQIGGRVNDWVNVQTWWDGTTYELFTSLDGSFILQSDSERTIEVPIGGEGNTSFREYHDDVAVDIMQYFRTPELAMSVNYDHDWIEGNYPAGYEVTLTVTESDGVTPKATTTLMTAEIPWWGGQTGFSTNVDGVVWDPERPDIQPEDWVFGQVAFEGTTYYSEVQLGTFDGQLSAETDSFTETLSASWLDPEVPVWVQCHPWGGPEGTPMFDTSVLPDGINEFTCDWTGEWDVQPGEQIAVTYLDPGGNWVYSVPFAYTDELILQVHYDHEWIQGYYEPDHTVFLQVLDSVGVEKAHITMTTAYFPDWGGSSGFDTNMEGANWLPNHPDIQPGDTIHGEVDGGAFTATVQIGTITADLDLDNDQVSGTVDAEWLPQGEEVKVSCEIWEWNSPPNQEDWVLPDGTDTYLCDWFEDGYDLNETSNLMVAYYESAGHKFTGEFRYPTPQLHISKWLEGGEPGEGGNVTFNIWYRNEGNADAVNTIITDTFVQGLTYVGDTSEFPKTVAGNQVIWQLGDLAPGDWINFMVFAHVDATEGNDIINTAVISSDGFDSGDEQNRTSTWQGTVIANNTHVNVGKGTWTWLPAPGQNYVYNINVCNNGPTGSTELTLTETLPDAVTLVSWWGREAGWSEISYTGNILTLQYPSISGGSCREVFIKVNLDANAVPGDELVNIVNIFAENDDPDEEDNEAWLQHNVGSPYTELSISLGWHSGSLTPGGQYRFGIYFYNDGNLPAEGPLPITLVLPSGVNFGGWSHWDWADFVGEPVVDGNTVTWLVDDLDPGYYGTIEVIANIDGGIPPGTEVTQEVTFVELPDETNFENNHASLSLTVQDHGPNLRIRMWGDWFEDRWAWYQLYVENIGDVTVEDVLLTDYLPADMELDGAVSVGFWEYWEVNSYEDYFTVYLDRLEPGWVANMYFNLLVPGVDPLPWGLVFTNTASVTEDPAETDPDDNTVEYALGTGPDMFVEKSLLTGEFHPGQEITYLVKFGNAQPGHAWWWYMAGNAVLVDTLPEGLSFVSSYWHCYQEEEWCEITPTIVGQELTWVTWPIGAGGWNEILLTVLINDEIEEGNALINTIEIFSDQPTVDLDPFPANNTSTYDPEVNFVAPAITSVDNTTFAFGEVGSFTITTSGYPTPIIWTDDGLPSWLTLVDQGDGTAILSGTPPEEGGVDYFLLKAANGVIPNAQQSFTLTWEGEPVYPLFLPLILR